MERQAKFRYLTGTAKHDTPVKNALAFFYVYHLLARAIILLKEIRDMAKSKSQKKKPTSSNVFYKTWWFWLIVILFIVGVFTRTDDNKNETSTTSNNNTSTQQTINDYSGQDAKKAYTELLEKGYSVKFVLDRNNNGGFTEEQLQDFVINDSFKSTSYSEMPFIVKRQISNDKTITLYIEYGSVDEANKNQVNREQALEEKLSIVSAMTACEMYGKSNYRNFKMHSIVGKIAESAYDDNTWYLKYYVDADGYKNKAMECYVSGTTENPSVTKFLVY